MLTHYFSSLFLLLTLQATITTGIPLPNKSTSPIGQYLSKSFSFRSLPSNATLASIIENLEYQVLDLDSAPSTPGAITSSSLRNLHFAVDQLKESSNDPKFIDDITIELNNLDRIFQLAERHILLLPKRKNTLISLYKRDSVYEMIINLNSGIQEILTKVDIASDTSSSLRPIVKTISKRLETHVLNVFFRTLEKLDNLPEPTLMDRMRIPLLMKRFAHGWKNSWRTVTSRENLPDGHKALVWIEN